MTDNDFEAPTPPPSRYSSGDWDKLLRIVELCRGRPFAKGQGDAIARELKAAGWPIAQPIVEGLRGEKALPSNLFGHITTLIDEAQKQIDERGRLNRYMADRPPYNTLPIWHALYRCMTEIANHHRAGMVNLQATALCDPYPDIHSWHLAGQPPTFSPLVDRLFKGYLAAEAKCRTSPDPLVTFLDTFHNALRQKREAFIERQKGGSHESTDTGARA